MSHALRQRKARNSEKFAGGRISSGDTSDTSSAGSYRSHGSTETNAFLTLGLPSAKLIAEEMEEEIGDQESILAWFSARDERQELPVAASLVSAFNLPSAKDQKQYGNRDRSLNEQVSNATERQSGVFTESFGYQRFLQSHTFNERLTLPFELSQVARSFSVPSLHRRLEVSISRNLAATDDSYREKPETSTDS